MLSKYWASAFSPRTNSKRKRFNEEKQIINWARESVVSIETIKKGDRFSANNISVKRPAPSKNEIEAKKLSKILGKVAKKNIRKNVKIKWSEIK